MRSALLAALLLLSTASHGMNIESFWEYSDPAASEARFRAALAHASADARLELLTQIARTYSLRKQYAEAHALLDDVERQLDGAGAAPRTRILLERGRTFNSAGHPATAAPLFERAWDTATAAGLDGLAVDAAHMLAIVAPPQNVARWTERGVELARVSSDTKARALLPALLNNHAWNLHDAGRYEEALPAFLEAEAAWHATGRQPQGRIATWSVARCLRSLKRYEEALEVQQRLETEWQSAGGADGYVYEEAAENLEALGRREQATAYFRRAKVELAKDPGIKREQPARWSRIVELAARSL